MRVLAALLLAVAFGALVVAQIAPPGPVWYLALYALPLTGTLFTVALAGVLLELLLGAECRPIASALAVALSTFALLFALFERAPGTLPPGLPLTNLGAKALSVAALGMAIGGAGLGAFGLRAPRVVPQIGSVLAWVGAAFVARRTIVALGLPFLSDGTLGIIAASTVVFVVSSWKRRALEGLEPSEAPQIGTTSSKEARLKEARPKEARP